MSQFKFACPICGQHISCDHDKAGLCIECPTCFRQIIVPQPPADSNAKFVLTAAELRDKPVPQLPVLETPLAKKSPTRGYLVWTLGFIAIAGIAVAGYSLRHKGIGSSKQPQKVESMAAPAAAASGSSTQPGDPWTLELDKVTLPDAPASGRIVGRRFTCQRATLHGSTLTLRQGTAWPPDVGLTIYLDTDRGEDMAGRRYSFSPSDRLPRMALRWKDPQGKPVKHNVTAPYALRIEFGHVNSNRLAGKIYCCIADPEKSYVAGAFEAEIRKPTVEQVQRR